MLKRWLYLTHRWIGIVSCLLFAMWFLSGLVMLYVPYPGLDRAEWLKNQQAIDWSQVSAPPGALSLTSETSQPRTLSLEMRGDRPVWRRLDWQGEQTLYSAATGAALQGPSQEEVRQIVSLYTGAAVEKLQEIGNDQWTVAERYDTHRPLWKADTAGGKGQSVYVSSKTGEIVLQTARTERFWNWVGSVPHWIYPTALRQDQAAWRQVVIWLSAPCLIAAITGIWIGILRVRLGKRRFRQGQISPYHGWMWWHHIPGIAGSLFLVLWVFSGLLSVDPGRIFASEAPSTAQRQTYAGAPSGFARWQDLSELAAGARRISLTSAAGQTYLRVERPDAADQYLDSDTLQPLVRDRQGILSKVTALYPSHAIASVEVLEKPDLYWYKVNGDLQLPVLRVMLDDRAGTWLHIDQANGEVLSTLDRRRRVYRWLYTMFHRWDVPVLLENRPLRDILIWTFSLFGLITSITGIKIGLDRLRPKKRLPRQSRAQR